MPKTKTDAPKRTRPKTKTATHGSKTGPPATRRRPGGRPTVRRIASTTRS